MYYFITTFGLASWEQCGYVLGGPVPECEDEKCHRLDLIHFCIYWTLRYIWAKAATALMRFRTCPTVIVRCREIDSYCSVSEDLYTVVDSEQSLSALVTSDLQWVRVTVTCLARWWLYPSKWWTYGAVWLLHGWYHVKPLPSRLTFCVHHATMHQFTVSFHAKPHT